MAKSKTFSERELTALRDAVKRGDTEAVVAALVAAKKRTGATFAAPKRPTTILNVHEITHAELQRIRRIERMAADMLRKSQTERATAAKRERTKALIRAGRLFRREWPHGGAKEFRAFLQRPENHWAASRSKHPVPLIAADANHKLLYPYLPKRKPKVRRRK